MALIVKKFGGTSLANVDMIKKVASRVVDSYLKGNNLVVVLSAMAGVTDNLIRLAYEISPYPDKRELDVLLATGEQTTTSILSMMLKQMGCKAESALAHQIGITTDSLYGNANIINIDVCNINKIVKDKAIAVIAGFQGCDSSGNITTLGRGGSDTSAVAIAAALKADLCEIYTDVEGIYTADPNICPEAKKLDKISYDEMFYMANLGTKVLHCDSIRFAKKYDVLVHVRSSFLLSNGTMMVRKNDHVNESGIVGIAYDLSYALIVIRGIYNNFDINSKILSLFSNIGISIDMIDNNILFDGRFNCTLTVPKQQFEEALCFGELAIKSMNILNITGEKNAAKISVIGTNIDKNPNLSHFIFEVLSKKNIYIKMINISKTKASCLVKEKDFKLAVRTLHSAFRL